MKELWSQLVSVHSTIFYPYQCVIPNHSRSNKVINYVFSFLFFFVWTSNHQPTWRARRLQTKPRKGPANRAQLRSSFDKRPARHHKSNQPILFQWRGLLAQHLPEFNKCNFFGFDAVLSFYMFMFFVFFFNSIWVYNFMFYVPLAFYGWLVLGRNGRIFKTTTFEGKTRQSWTHLHVLFHTYRFS